MLIVRTVEENIKSYSGKSDFFVSHFVGMAYDGVFFRFKLHAPSRYGDWRRKENKNRKSEGPSRSLRKRNSPE